MTDGELTENQQAIHHAVADQTVFSPAEAEVVRAYVGHNRTLKEVADQLDKNP